MKTKHINGRLAVLCACVLLAQGARAQSGAPATPEQASPMPGMDHSGMNHGDMPGMAQPPIKPSQPAQRQEQKSVGKQMGQEATHGKEAPDKQNMQGMEGMQHPSNAGPGKPGTRSPPPVQGTEGTHEMQGMEGMHHMPEAQGKQGTQAMPGMQGGHSMGAGMQGMSMGPMQGGKAPPDARDPNAYAEGTKPSHLGGMEMADNSRFGRVLFNNLEFAKSDDDHGRNIDAEAWYGGDYNKTWFKEAQDERSNGRLQTCGPKRCGITPSRRSGVPS
jgi:copper resistance protein B